MDVITMKSAQVTLGGTSHGMPPGERNVLVRVLGVPLCLLYNYCGTIGHTYSS